MISHHHAFGVYLSEIAPNKRHPIRQPAINMDCDASTKPFFSQTRSIWTVETVVTKEDCTQYPRVTSRDRRGRSERSFFIYLCHNTGKFKRCLIVPSTYALTGTINPVTLDGLQIPIPRREHCTSVKVAMLVSR